MHSIFICTTYISKHILYYIHVFNLTTNDDDDDDDDDIQHKIVFYTKIIPIALCIHDTIKKIKPYYYYYYYYY